MRLQVAVLRRERIDAVVRKRDGFGVLELREHAWRKDVRVMRRVALAGAQRLLSGSRPAGQEGDVSVSPGLRDAVVSLQSIATSTELGGGSRGELIAGRQKDFCSEALEQRPPAV